MEELFEPGVFLATQSLHAPDSYRLMTGARHVREDRFIHFDQYICDLAARIIEEADSNNPPWFKYSGPLDGNLVVRRSTHRLMDAGVSAELQAAIALVSIGAVEATTLLLARDEGLELTGVLGWLGDPWSNRDEGSQLPSPRWLRGLVGVVEGASSRAGWAADEAVSNLERAHELLDLGTERVRYGLKSV